jgi:hypothetical protein
MKEKIFPILVVLVFASCWGKKRLEITPELLMKIGTKKMKKQVPILLVFKE